jgi:hypothetical protein
VRKKNRLSVAPATTESHDFVIEGVQPSCASTFLPAGAVVHSEIAHKFSDERHEAKPEFAGKWGQAGGAIVRLWAD